MFYKFLWEIVILCTSFPELLAENLSQKITVFEPSYSICILHVKLQKQEKSDCKSLINHNKFSNCVKHDSFCLLTTIAL